MNENYYAAPMSAAEAAPADRATFIKRTYLHLAGAILAFGLLEGALLRIPGIHQFVGKFMGGGMSWLIVLGAFMAVAWIADKWAHSDTSVGMQYAGLGLYVVAEAIIFLPLIITAQMMTMDNTIIFKAVGTTFAIFGGLTGVVLTTRKDFSFLGGFLKFAFFAALGAIVLSLVFGFPLGIWFSVIMVLVAGAMVLYQTSQILHQYGTEQHVAASLGLFASFALLLWYVLQIFMSRE